MSITLLLTLEVAVAFLKLKQFTPHKSPVFTLQLLCFKPKLSTKE